MTCPHGPLELLLTWVELEAVPPLLEGARLLAPVLLEETTEDVAVVVDEVITTDEDCSVVLEETDALDDRPAVDEDTNELVVVVVVVPEDADEAAKEEDFSPLLPDWELLDPATLEAREVVPVVAVELEPACPDELTREELLTKQPSQAPNAVPSSLQVW